MGYCEYMKTLLVPLGLYELDSGYGAHELAVLGAQLDALADNQADAEREMIIPTAAGSGLEAYESIMPYIPAYTKIGERRAALMALLQIDWTSFTGEKLNNTLAGCGVNAVVYELDEALTVGIEFPDQRGIPDAIEEIKARIEEIIPCHLNINYLYAYIIWSELETAFASWSELESHNFTWEALEKFDIRAI